MCASVDVKIVVAHGEVSVQFGWVVGVIVARKIRWKFVCCRTGGDKVREYTDRCDITCLMTGHVEYLGNK